ncbi:hypothetical protein ACTAQI_05300 [Pseudarthrobacter sp. alpha12b]
MPATTDRPAAVRAVAFIRPSRWLRRPVRLVRYDAYWSDGHVDFDVSLSKMMYRGYPADFAPINESVHAHCPEVGAGQWVNEYGSVVDGPARPGPSTTGRVKGARRKYGVSAYQPNPKARLAWRLGGGLAGIGAGVLLIGGPIGAGFGGFVGAVCCIAGFSSLAGLLPGKSRWTVGTSGREGTVEAIRDDIIAAIAALCTVARAENDEPRLMTADYLQSQFTGVTDARTLRAAAAGALSLYGGNGSFPDVGTAELYRAVNNLRTALQRGRTVFPRRK